jgi:hypothetical protein
MAYDWALMKREYIRGYEDEKEGHIPEPTLKQIAKRHSCSYDYLRKKASPKNENWEQQRHIFVTKTSQKITEKEIEKISDDAVDFDNKSLDAANAGINEGLERLKDTNLSTHDYLKISTALTNFQKLGKLALGEPTEHTFNEGSQSHKHSFSVDSQKQILEEEGYDDQ